MDTVAKMGVDWGVASCASQWKVLGLRDMHARLGLPKLLGKAKINNVDLAPFRSLTADCEVFWFDIPVYVVMSVHKLNPPHLYILNTGK